MHMSSGEAKRTLIARALVHEPKTLLFDEPSNALDIGAQFQLRDTMRELAQSGLAILLVTHHVSEIIPEIERVIFVACGARDGGWDEGKSLNGEKSWRAILVPRCDWRGTTDIFTRCKVFCNGFGMRQVDERRFSLNKATDSSE